MIGNRIRLYTTAQQVASRFAFGPTPDDVATQRDDVPGLELGRPGGDLLWMLAHELFHTAHEGFANGAHLGFEIFVMFLGDLPVTPQPLAVIVLVEVFTEDFGHGAFRFAIVAQHLFQTVLGLGMTGAISRAGRC